MRPHQHDRAPRGRHRTVISIVLLPGVLVLLSGCTKEVSRGWLPSTPETTNQTGRIISLWTNSWIAALLVGALVWGLLIWCIVAYRRRRDDPELPPQVRYNVPLEILYTIVPLIMIAPLYYYTAVDEAAIADTSKKPDLTINVVGKQWSWDFNYLDSGVYEVGLQAQTDGRPGVEKEIPTLYLPVDKSIRFQLTSRDVIHSFWIPSFLYKMDVIPGVDNQFQLTPQREGSFKGKCAELCGEYHSEMLFNVKVVSQDVYDAHMQALRAAGQVGRLDSNLGRSKTPPGGAVPGNPQLATATPSTGSN